MVAHSASDSDPATHGDIDLERCAATSTASAWRGDNDRLGADLRGDIDRLGADLRGDIDRLRLELRGDIERAIHQQTWRILSLGVAIAAILAAILRLT